MRDWNDYTGAVLFNACTSELWRFTVTLRRRLARKARPTGKAPGRLAPGLLP